MVCALALLPAGVLSGTAMAAKQGEETFPEAKQKQSRLARSCDRRKITTGEGRVTIRHARRAVLQITNQFMAQYDVKATLLGINVRKCKLVSAGLGESITGVNANPNMHWRIGSIAIPLFTNLFLQLVDERKLSLDDPLSKWFPQFPNANQVTLRMLASTTTGYPDFAQRNPNFVNLLFPNPFRQWTDDELIATAFSQPVTCPPATCFSYAHTNFVLLGKVIEAATGRTVTSLIKRRVIRPLGLRETRVTDYPFMQPPVLHSYMSDRGPYEDSTYWSPSWSIGDGVVMNSTIGDVVKEAGAIAAGKLISKRSSQAMFTNYAAGLPGIPSFLGYGLGILTTTNGWELQNPFIDGYDGLMAYLPGHGIGIGAVMTKGPAGADAAANGQILNTVLLTAIGNYLAPNNQFPVLER